ncbi:hypothetical protein ACIRPT_39965 [Streptomyces sp. NPDC101227]|uniref:DUF7224 domain-containing protein n=1 Tax=Streptomyces sp. NPDC101227 TaxID=3366136 RepID=UPI0038122816
MLWRTVLRSSSASWLAPLLAAFVALLLSDDLTAKVTHGYWPSVLGAANFALPFVAPACATAGAWEGTRITRGNVAGWAPTRSTLGIALPLLAPVFVLGAVGMAVAAALTISTGRPDVGTPPIGMVLVWMVILAAHSMAGFLLGKRLPLVIATPLALVLSFVLTAYPAAMEPLWLRHMVTGGMSSCCSLDQTPNWRAAASALLLALAVISACALALTALHQRTRAVLISTALVVGIAGSGGLAYGLPADPVTPRAEDQLQCAGENPRVCLWPELSRQAAMIRENASDARHRLQEAGLAVPKTLTMEEHSGGDALFIGTWPDPSASEVRAGVGTALMPSDPPSCAQSGSNFPGADAYGPTAAWLALTAGAESQEAAGRYGEKEAAVAARVQQSSHDAQLAWFRQNSKALRDCTTRPAPIPSAHALETSR